MPSLAAWRSTKHVPAAAAAFGIWNRETLAASRARESFVFIPRIVRPDTVDRGECQSTGLRVLRGFGPPWWMPSLAAWKSTKHVPAAAF